MFRSIQPRGLLSFGPETPALELRPLNVLIGLNGSGKSNLIEVFGLLHAAATDLLVPIREGGGAVEWFWKGHGAGLRRRQPGSVEAVLDFGTHDLRYSLALNMAGTSTELSDERLEGAAPFSGFDQPYIYYAFQGGHAVLNVKDQPSRRLNHEEIDPQQSIFSQRKDPEQYPEITWAGKSFDRMAFYRDWEFGINASPRLVHTPDQRVDYLEEDASNLALVLNRLMGDPPVKKVLLQAVQDFLPDATDIRIRIEAGVAELRVEEQGGFSTPAARLSDGTLRWLALLAVLLNPTPPPVIFIEEPEMGLHPDMTPTLARLLTAASERTQLIVTTHSEALVDAYTDAPETIIVCEKSDSATSLSRLSGAELKDWLQDYSLGQAWLRGAVGGRRW